MWGSHVAGEMALAEIWLRVGGSLQHRAILLWHGSLSNVLDRDNRPNRVQELVILTEPSTGWYVCSCGKHGDVIFSVLQVVSEKWDGFSVVSCRARWKYRVGKPCWSSAASGSWSWTITAHLQCRRHRSLLGYFLRGRRCKLFSEPRVARFAPSLVQIHLTVLPRRALGVIS